MSDWIEEARRYYEAHPEIESELAAHAAGQAPTDTMSVPERILVRRARLKVLLRQLARSARTKKQRTEVKKRLVDAVIFGDMTIQQTREAAKWMERRA